MSAYLRELSEANKEALLQSERESAQDRAGQADQLLENVKRLNPSLASYFQPKKVVLEHLRFRMLCYPEAGESQKRPIPPDVHDDVKSFIIISYTWHPRPQDKEPWQPAAACRPIDNEWKISQPMINKILSLRLPGEAVWIDQLCIRQGDSAEEIEERRVAVGSMDVIYRSARRLLILLEDTQLDEGEQYAAMLYWNMFEAFSASARGKSSDEKGNMIKSIVHPAMVEIEEKVKKWDREWESTLAGLTSAVAPSTNSPSSRSTNTTETPSDDTTPTSEVEPSSRRFIMKMLSGRWHSRAWCAHECRVVKHGLDDNPLFLCFGSDGGIEAFEFRFIFFITLQMRELEPQSFPADSSLHQFLNEQNPNTFYQRSVRLQSLFPSPSDHISVYEHYLRISVMGCTFGRDLVSIALNTARIPLVFNGNFEADGDRKWLFSVLNMAAGDPGPLVYNGQKLYVSDLEAQSKMISWVESLPNSALDDWKTTWEQNAIHYVGKDYIQLDLYLCQELPTAPSENARELSQSIIDTYLQRLCQDLSSSDAETTTQTTAKLDQVVASFSGTKESFLVDLLAATIDCGVDWIARLPQVMKKDTQGIWIHDTLTGYDDSRFEPAATALLSGLGISLENTPDFVTSRLQPTVRFLSCIFDSRMRFLTLSPRPIRLGPADFALTPSISNLSYVVVPVAVAHLPGFAKKAWIVDPFDPKAPPEVPEDHTKIVKLDDGRYNVPVVTSDHVTGRYADDVDGPRAAPDPVKRSWRLRQRNVMYGHSGPIKADGVSIIRLNKQKVYGAKDYDWAAINRSYKVMVADIEALQSLAEKGQDP